jgi:hypothetical protein
MLSDLIEKLNAWHLPPKISVVYHTWERNFAELRAQFIYCPSKKQFAKANMAILAAREPWIVITHDDDILLESTYELLEIAKDSDCSVVVANAVSLGPESENWNSRHNKSFYHFFVSKQAKFSNEVKMHGNPIVFSGALLNRDKIASVGGFNENYIHFGDFEMWLRLSGMSEFRYVNLVNLRYRLHPDQNSSKRSVLGRLEMNFIRSQYHLTSIGEENGYLRKLKDVLSFIQLILLFDISGIKSISKLRSGRFS